MCFILNLVRSTKKYNETYLASFVVGLTKETHNDSKKFARHKTKDLSCCFDNYLFLNKYQKEKNMITFLRKTD